MWHNTQGGDGMDMNPNTNHDLVRMVYEIDRMKCEIAQ